MNIPIMINVMFEYRNHFKEGLLPIRPMVGEMILVKVGDERVRFNCEQVIMVENESTIEVQLSARIRRDIDRVHALIKKDVNWEEQS